MRLSKNSFCLAVAVCFLSLAPWNEAPAQEKIRISYSSVDASNAIWYVARDAGLYKKNGLDVDLIFIPSTTTSVASLLAGDVPVGNASGGGVAAAVVGGADLVIVGCYLNTLPYELVVSESVKSGEDLRGKSIGISRVGSASDVAARALVRGLGLEPDKDVPILQMGGQPELAAGLENKRIFAATAVPPALVRMQKAGAKILVAPKSIGFRFPHVGIVVRKSLLASRRETVKNFLRGYSEGIAMLSRDKEAGKRAISRYVRSEDPEVLEATWQYAIDTLERIPYPDPEGFKVVLEELARTRPEVAKARPEQFIDDSVVRELEAEGFFKKIYGR